MKLALPKKLLLSIPIVPLFLALCVMKPDTARAVLLLTDDFTSYTLASNLDGQGAWTKGGSGPSCTVQNTTPLTYAGYNGGGLNYVVMGTPGGTSSRTYSGFTATTAVGNTFYVSFLLRLTATTAAGDYFITLGDATTGTAYGPRLFAKTSGAGFVLGVSKANTTVNYGSTVLSLNTTYLVVMRLSGVSGSVNDLAYVWVNPSLASEPTTGSAECSDTTGTDAGYASGNVGNFHWHNRSANNPAGSFDAVRVAAATTSATAWADLAAAGAAPAAPTVGAATAISSSTFTANWSVPSSAYGFYLDVSTASDFSSFVAGYSNLDLTYATNRAVTNLAASTTYYYRLRAYNATGTSPNSLTNTVTTSTGPLVWTVSAGLWSTGANWLSGIPPANGAAMTFAGAGGISTNDLLALLADSLVFSNSAGAYTISGNALALSNGVVNNSTAPQTFSAPLTLGAAQTFNAAAGALNVSGSLTNGGFLLTMNTAAASTNSGNIVGAGGLTKSGAGPLTLSGANAFTGPVIISAGNLQISGGAALPDNTNVSLANVASAALTLAANETIGSLAGGDAATLALGANTLTVGGDGSTNTFTSSITGTGKLVKTGAGILLLNKTTSYGSGFTLRVENGLTDLNRGGVALTNLLPAGTRVELAGGNLQLSASAQANFPMNFDALDVYSDSTLTFARSGTINSQTVTNWFPLNFKNAARLTLAHSNVNSQTTYFFGASNTLSGHATLAITNYTTIFATPIVESGGSYGLTKTGAGQLALSASNTYTGPTTNLQGVISMNDISTFGNGSGLLVLAGGDILNTSTRATAPIANPVLMTADTTIYGNGTLTATNQRFFPFSNNSITTVGGTLTIRNAAASGTNRFFLRLAGGGFNFTQPIIVGSTNDLVSLTSILQPYNDTNVPAQTFSGNISGVGSIVKSAANAGAGGVTILTASNTYAGGTTISEGTLLVNNTTGSGTGTNFLSVTSGGTLGGTGIILGAVTNSFGSVLQPGLGNDTTTLTISNSLGLAGSAQFNLNRTNAQNSSRAAGLTTVTYGGTLIVTNSGDALQAGDTFTLFSATSYAGSFTNIVLPPLGLNLGWTTNLTTSGSLTVISLTTPTTLTLTSSANPAGYLDGLTFTAALAPTNATGLVRFFTNGVAFSTNSLTLGSAVSSTFNSLPRGTNLITAIYAGNLPYLPSTNTLNQIITNHPPTVANATYSRNVALSQFKILVSNLLTNSTDVDGDSLTLANFTTSTNGVTLTLAGGYLFYSNANPVADTFTYSVSDGFGGTNSATVFITADTTPLFGQSIALTPSGSTVDLSFAGIPGFSYTIVRSPDLAVWTDLWTTNAPPGGIFQFTDTNAPSPSAFYRLRFNP